MGAPWRAALGAEAAVLSPRLRAYTSPVPAGSVGIGHGRFDVIGCRRWWLRPLLGLVGGPSIFPILAVDAPFEVRNRGVAGRAAVRAERTVVHAGRTWTMRDEIGSPGPGAVVDLIGVPPRLEVAFLPAVVDGGLRLTSTAAALRFGPLRLPLGHLAPRVALTERFDTASDRQHVALTVDAPVLGRIYEYSGSFTYEVQEAG